MNGSSEQFTIDTIFAVLDGFLQPGKVRRGLFSVIFPDHRTGKIIIVK